MARRLCPSRTLRVQAWTMPLVSLPQRARPVSWSGQAAAAQRAALWMRWETGRLCVHGAPPARACNLSNCAAGSPTPLPWRATAQMPLTAAARMRPTRTPCGTASAALPARWAGPDSRRLTRPRSSRPGRLLTSARCWPLCWLERAPTATAAIPTSLPCTSAARMRCASAQSSAVGTRRRLAARACNPQPRSHSHRPRRRRHLLSCSLGRRRLRPPQLPHPPNPTTPATTRSCR
mmetsp:Transcript_14/g.33  ORF Transcript_14/g.33 Transcript_14/m.33 type:complete len:234 (-) Transcript_14:892-1593(-)